MDDLVKEFESLEMGDKKPTLNKGVLCCGLDIGTMTLSCARDDSNEIKITRNVFLPVSKDDISISELSNINYVESPDGELFIIGEDAFRFSNIFGKEVSRPMEKGLISAKEIYAIDVLTMIIKNLIGDTKNADVYCSYSVPAESIDEARSVVYHEKVIGRILNNIGANYHSVNEGMAVVFSECAKENFTGIGISFGAGMCNCAIGFKGVEAAKFSTSRSGDYVDKSTAESLNIITNRATNLKEKFLNLSEGFENVEDRKRKRVLEALTHFYASMIDYNVKKIIQTFEEKIDVEIDEDLPIIISGGTSLPIGFLELFRDTLNKYKLPFKVSEVRKAKNPLTAVASGLLIKTMSDVKR